MHLTLIDLLVSALRLALHLFFLPVGRRVQIRQMPHVNVVEDSQSQLCVEATLAGNFCEEDEEGDGNHDQCDHMANFLTEL